MALVNKIDSNITGLRYAEEASIKTLPGSPVWYPLEPNSYSDFGGEITTIARDPINPSRQRKKGVTTDLDATGGFNTDLTQKNVQDLMQGFMYADARHKVQFGGAGEITNVDGTGEDFEAASGLDAFSANDLVLAAGFSVSQNNGLHLVTSAAATSLTVGSDLADETPPATATLQQVGVQGAAGDLDVDASGALPLITSTSLDFTTLGIIPGEWIFVGGDTAGTRFATAANNGFKRVRAVTANALTIDKSSTTMATEASTTETVRIFFGSVIKNESGSLIKRRTYQLERTLGAPDDSLPNEIQAQYIIGAVPNTVAVNVAQADKVTLDLDFLGTDSETIDGPTALKTGARPAIVEAAAFNTSSDFSRIKLSVIDASANPSPLFAFVTELTVNINNNLTANKAVSVLGAFDVTAGTFEVGATLSAYFADVAAIGAIRDNEDVTLDMHLVKENAGITIDMPLVSLGDGRPDVEKDAAIIIPLTLEAADGSKVDPALDHTLLWVFWHYLPDAADV